MKIKRAKTQHSSGISSAMKISDDTQCWQGNTEATALYNFSRTINWYNHFGKSSSKIIKI